MPNRIRIISVVLIGVMILLSITLQPGDVLAGTSTWESIGPGGGEVFAVAIDPVNPNILYAGGSSNGLFKSTNGGDSWFNTGLAGYQTTLLAIDPNQPSNIYAGTSGGGVYKSSDSGRTWNSINRNISETQIWSLAIDPITPTTLYVGTNAKLYRSIDGGVNWNSLPNLVGPISAIAIDPLTPETLYAGVWEDGLYKSTDSGQNWIASNQGLAPGQTFSATVVVIHPTNSNLLFTAAWGRGVYKSEDGAKSWNVVNQNLNEDRVNTLAFCPNLTSLYAGTFGGGVFMSISLSNVQWSDLNENNFQLDIWHLAFKPTLTNNQATIYAGTIGAGVIKTTDSGRNWVDASQDMHNVDVTSLAVGPSNTGILGVGSYNHNVFMSANSGETWQSSGRISDLISTLVIDPADPNILYAGTEWSGVHRSTDFGLNWSQVNTGLTHNTIRALAIHPTETGTLLAATQGSGVFESGDGGQSWNAYSDGLTDLHVRALLFDPSNPDLVYAGTFNQHVYKRTASSSTWERLGNITGASGSIEALAVHPTQPATIYVGLMGNLGFEGVFKSVDGGESWTAVNTGLDDIRINDIVIHPRSAETLFAASLSGVFISKNGGQSWEAFNTGLENLNVQALAITEGISNMLYAGTDGSSVFAIDISLPPGAFSKTAPADGATGQSLSPTLSWGSSASAASYEYCLGTTSGDCNVKDWTSTGSDLTVTPTGLSSNTTYYWQVRSRNTAGVTQANNGNWWSFTSELAPPNAFNKNRPSNGSIDQPINVRLDWHSGANVDRYEYCLGTVNNDCDITDWTSTGTNPWVMIDAAPYTTHFWQVRAINAGGTTYANNGDWWSFTTKGIPPEAFSKTTPADGATSVSLSPTLTWGASAGAVRYEYCLGLDPEDGDCDVIDWTGTEELSQSVTVSNLTHNHTYGWQVRAINAEGETYANGGTWWSFTTVDEVSDQQKIFLPLILR